ncbi:hypothetical protein BDZ45DRAFT_755129 [Acephala macrosclerotiorum]|nr:hypothetical protein BDZ45DRAFT_755129 [Acephala macrosclerotiorum]
MAFGRQTGIAPSWLLRRNKQDSPLCRFPLESRDGSNNAKVSQCPSDATKYCCATSSEIDIPLVNSPSSAASSTSTATFQGLSTGAKAGISVLAAVAALMAVISLVLFMMMRRM